MGNEQVRVYVMTHKAFEAVADSMYVPVHVGRAAWRRARGGQACAETEKGEDAALLAYTGDDSGDNISEQNCYFSELTGLYWVWKNVHDIGYVGTCHYRRYLLAHGHNAIPEEGNRCAGLFREQAAPHGGIFTADEVRAVLASHDVITTKNLQLNFSYYEGFASHHKIRYLDETARVIAERHPQYYADFDRLVHEKHTYFGNMLICRKELYDRYCAWLFDILFEVQRRVAVEEEDAYHRRIFGFISEFLQYVWIVHNQLRVYECMVGMLGEKAEVTETKQRLAEYFARADYEGAKAYFLAAQRQRPDILMEASDITGELHLAMEVIAIAGLEQQAYGTNLLGRICDFRELMSYCNRLNRYAAQILRGEAEDELRAWAKKEATAVAVDAACAVMGAAQGGRIPME